jgi:hypothetical protein
MAARLPLRRVFLCLAAILAAATAGVPAPVAKAKPKPVPADDTVTPAIDAAKLAGDVLLSMQYNENRKKSSNNLNYSVKNDNKLSCNVLDESGKPMLSWRVLLLPYLDQQALYNQFKLDEPWDSKNNRPLIEKMPKVLASPRVKVKGKGYTVYQVFSGPGALFDKGKTKYNIGNIPDGNSNTIFTVEASEAVPWSKPADIPFDKDKKVPDFGKAYDGTPLALIMDGSVRTLDLKKISATTLKLAIIPDDGMALGPDW